MEFFFQNLIFFIFGAIFGSFVYCIGYRITKLESIITSSKCDHCFKKLSFFELIPIFSYLFQKGRCNYCNIKINPMHFIFEVLYGFCFMFIISFYNKNLLELLLILSILILLGIQSASDINEMMILNFNTFLLFIFSLILGLIRRDFFEILLSITIITFFYLILKKIFLIIKKIEIVGEGDFFVIISISCFMKLFDISLFCLLSGFISLVLFFFSKKDRLPFLPSITMSVFFLLILQKFPLFNYYS